MTKEETAWLAGLFEGEGCVIFAGKYSVTLHVNMTDRDVIERCRQIAGVGNIYTAATGRIKPLHAWCVTRAEHVEPLIHALLPWMCGRRGARMRAGLVRLKLIRRSGFCGRGHPMSGENLYESRGGKRFCRACAAFRQERDRARDKKPARRAWDRARDANPARLAQKRAAMARYVERQKAVKT